MDGHILGRTLVDLKRDCLTVRVANVIASRQKLKKGLELTVCQPVASVTTRVKYIGRAPCVQNRVDTADSSPVMQNSRRLPLGKTQEADSALKI